MGKSLKGKELGKGITQRKEDMKRLVYSYQEKMQKHGLLHSL